MLKKILLGVSLIFISFSSNAYASSREDNFLNLTAKSAIVIDSETGEVIYSYNESEKTQMASTTKLMTALILSEYRNKGDLIRFTKSAMLEPSTSVYKDIAPYLKENDLLSAESVMNGLLLKSGNDMATIIAEDISGSKLEFSYLMDDKAKELGMNDSDFYTPSGLDTDNVLDGENHYSTAYDMALLGLASYKNEWVRESMSLKNYEMKTEEGYSFVVENTNKNLGLNGCIGGKTGFTTKAGRCLVAVYERDDRVLIGVVLGGTKEGYFEDMNKIMDFAYKEEKSVLYNKNDVITEKSCVFKPWIWVGKEKEYNIPMYISEDISLYKNAFNENYVNIEIKYNDVSLWNLKDDTIVGELVMTCKNEVKMFNLYTNVSTKDFIKDNMKTYLITASILILSAFLLLLFLKNRLVSKNNN